MPSHNLEGLMPSNEKYLKEGEVACPYCHSYCKKKKTHEKWLTYSEMDASAQDDFDLYEAEQDVDDLEYELFNRFTGFDTVEYQFTCTDWRCERPFEVLYVYSDQYGSEIAAKQLDQTYIDENRNYIQRWAIAIFEFFKF